MVARTLRVEGEAVAVPGKTRRRTRAVEEPLDRLVHEPVRLAILSGLAAAGAMSFSDLKRLLKITDGNLSVHARKLEEAGLVTCTKSFAGRQPHTEFALTGEGRKRLEKYLRHLEAVIRNARGG